MENLEAYYQLELSKIDREIAKQRKEYKSGVVCMCVSLIILWPLLIIGLLIASSAEEKIKELENKKSEIRMLMAIHAENKRKAPQSNFVNR